MMNYTEEKNCTVFYCGAYRSDDVSNVCSGLVPCISANNCSTCPLGYGGQWCQEFGCGNYSRIDDDVCSSHGQCVVSGYCECEEGYFLKPDNVTCQLCEVGYLSHPTNPHKCQKCPGGYSSQPILGENATCYECEQGYYELDGVCIKCPRGTYGPEIALTEISKCLPCPPGRYGHTTGLTRQYFCSPCPSGSYQPYYGKNSSESCLTCSGGVAVCPKGSPKSSFAIKSGNEENVDLSELSSIKEGKVDYLTKVYLLVSFVAVALCVIVVLCLSNYVCCCTQICCKKCLSFKAWDKFYNMSHDADEGEPVLKKSTARGGCFSLFALVIVSTLMSWSLSDFISGNKLVKNSTEFFFQDDEDTTKEDITFGVSFYGNLENCTSLYSYRGFQHSSISLQSTHLSSYVGEEVLGCHLEIRTTEFTSVDVDDMELTLSIGHEEQLIRMMEYSIKLPHCDQNQKVYTVDGRLFTPNGTLMEGSVVVPLFRSEYRQISTWDLFLSAIDTSIEIPIKYGIGASVLSSSKEVVNDIPQLLNSSVSSSWRTHSTFTFKMKLSSFKFVVQEYYNQSLLNIVAQMFALFGLGVSVCGFLFGRTESCSNILKCSLVNECCDVLSTKCAGLRKGAKITDGNDSSETYESEGQTKEIEGEVEKNMADIQNMEKYSRSKEDVSNSEELEEMKDLYQSEVLVEENEEAQREVEAVNTSTHQKNEREILDVGKSMETNELYEKRIEKLEVMIVRMQKEIEKLKMNENNVY